MSLVVGQELLGYTVLEKLGAGGMGEVYRARDRRLEREVAIKVLPAALRGDPERLERLEREARLLAALNHPHVATLHGVEETDEGSRLLVMELVEGSTLAERLRRGALPLDEVYLVGAQIADALAAAHDRGIVHRDLKPGNVMLARGGVKLLDFGLARVAGSPLGGELGTARTLDAGAEPLTREGVLLGTLPYMAPEQLQGRPADRSSDLWALGAILYEMAAGRPAFAAESPASLIAAILERPSPRLAEVLEPLPPMLDHLVTGCLVKNPEQRRRSAWDLSLDLRWLAAQSSDPADPPGEGAKRQGRRAGRETVLSLAVIALGVALALALALRPERRAIEGERPEVRFDLEIPSLVWNATETGIALSPSGDALLYASVPRSGSPSMLWLDELDGLGPRALEGTEGAQNPFWAPDGRQLGYVQSGVIRILDRGGGPHRTLVQAGDVFGPPSWGSDGTILFAATGDAAGAPPRIRRVPATGGEPEEIPLPAVAWPGYWYPQWLPGGRRFLTLTVRSPLKGPPQTFVAELAGGEPKRLEGIHSRVEYSSGHLVYADQGLVVARAFDPERAVFEGEPFTLGETTGSHLSRTGMSVFSVASQSAALAFGRTPRSVEPRWIERGGRDLGRLELPGPVESFRISPSGDRLAIEIVDVRRGESKVWVYETARGVATPLLPGPGNKGNPVWSPDGSRLAYTTDEARHPQLYIRPADGGGEPLLVCCEPGILAYAEDWSSDGRWIAFRSFRENTDLWLVSAAGASAPQLFAGGVGHQGFSRFSPDGQWVAFASSELGPTEVWVAPRDDGSARRKVSSQGGHRPVWSPDGSELFYGQGGSVRVVPFESATGRIGAAADVFSVEPPLEIEALDVSPDGDRFLVLLVDPEASRSTVTVVLDWTDASATEQRLSG